MSTLTTPPGPVVPELLKERAAATFDSTEMKHYLRGGRDKAEREAEIAAIVERDPVFIKEDRYFLNRVDQYKRSLQKSARCIELTRELGLTSTEDLMALRRAVDEDLPIGLHDGMFTPTIMGQGTDEQIAKWGPLAKNYAIVGTYAQTELGHGSYVQGIETTATFDKRTQEFVLHSPTLTATKWWPGCLGKTSNHAVVLARMLINGADHGVHAFIVQLRSQRDHMPVPGVTIGDIGPKFSYETNDNGFLRFNNVRIPRENMLMRYARVDPDGTYTKPPHSKLTYATMVYMRAYIIMDASHTLGRAATISIRYSAVRRQFPSGDGEGAGADVGREVQIIDYQTQQGYLFPLMAAAYAFHFTGEYMSRLYKSFLDGVGSQDFAILPEVHATSSGLKAVTTWITTDGIEQCRKCCGGHGYSRFSGLPGLFATYVPACTYEGENTVMCLQTARFLLKAHRQAAAGKKTVGNSDYLSEPGVRTSRCQASSELDWTQPSVLLAAYKHRAARLIAETASRLEAAVGQGTAPATAFESAKMDLVRSAKAHCMLIVLRKFDEAVAATTSASLRSVLGDLLALFGAHFAERDLGEFVEDGYMSAAHCAALRGAVRLLLARIRPNAVALVDSFGFSDHLLNSALGRHDGRVYEALYALAQKEPLNATPVAPGYEEHLRPMMDKGARIASRL